jgi:SAM-dependent methyltransferase
MIFLVLGEKHMLERVQERSWLHLLGLQEKTHLYGMQKAIAQWAIVDDYNNILDLSCQDTHLLRYFSQKYSLRACGIADDPEHARTLRAELPNAEIFCARKEDIPWRDQAFDAVFYQMKKTAVDYDAAFLREAARVLKPGGQLLIAVQGVAEPLYRAGSLFGFCDTEDHLSPSDLMKSMESSGLEDVSWRLAQPMVAIAMGWRRR